jgi:hypothetical protein
MLWGAKGGIARCCEARAIRREYCAGDVTDDPVASGHYIAGEAADEPLTAYGEFF